jgi:outer membrane protein OmpA-like peptidoglycan-associated protein
MKRFIILLLLLWMCDFVLVAQEKKLIVLFDFNKYDIPDSSLLKLAKVINQQNIDRVLLEGHCDSVGSKQYNIVLSNNRANEIKKLFVQNGIPKTAIKTCIGFGKEKPLNNNANEFERQLNRRVVITIFENENTQPTQQPQTALLTKDLPIIKKYELSVGKSIVLENLLFIPGKHIIKEESKAILEELFELMHENPKLEIEIQGHVCCTMDETDGFDWDEGTHNLSETRAKAVYQFLTKKGINGNRMIFKGYGGSQKLNEDESTEELKSENRRVEFKVLKM